MKNLLISFLFVSATCSASYINVLDSMSNGNLLKDIYDTGDGMHISQAGDDKIYEAIIAGNKPAGSILAIRLISFDAVRLNKSKAGLNWKLDPFQQADTYIIMKSSDGIHFQEMATVSSNSNAVYSFEDNVLLPGINYYKLMMIENIVDTTESKTVVVTNNQTGLAFTGWERSAAGDVIFFINCSEPKFINWQVIDVSGRILHKGNRQLYPGMNPVQVNMSGTGSGIYYFKFNCAGEAKQPVQPFTR